MRLSASFVLALIVPGAFGWWLCPSPEAWNDTSRVYSIRPLKYDAWTVSANLLGTFDLVTQYNTGVLQTREIHFGDQNEITSIVDVS